MDNPSQFLTYVIVKYMAYAFWSFIGIRLLNRSRYPSILPASLRLGLARLFIGIGFGFGIFIVGAFLHLNAPAHPLFAYLAVYAPVRWLEWSIMASIIEDSSSLMPFLLGSGWNSRWWRIGGIVISHLADIPLILSGTGISDMLPVGRFLC